MKYIQIILLCFLAYSSTAQESKALPDHRIPTKELKPIKMQPKAEEAKVSPIVNPQLDKIKRLLSCLNRLKVTVGSLRLIGSEGDGTKHVLQTPTGKTIVMNLETGDAELVSSAGLKRIIRIIPTKGNSTIPLYTLNSITDTGKWIYKDEKGKDVLIESGVNTDQQKQEKPKFVFKLIPITPSPPLPDMIIEDLSLPEVCISPRKC